MHPEIIWFWQTPGLMAGKSNLEILFLQSGDTVRSVFPERIARAELVGQARLGGLYGQHWNYETVHSVIKRKFGDTVRSRTTRLHFREVFVKGLITNL